MFIDNLDSFTFNLVHCLEVSGAAVEVLRNEGKEEGDKVSGGKVYQPFAGAAKPGKKVKKG